MQVHIMKGSIYRALTNHTIPPIKPLRVSVLFLSTCLLYTGVYASVTLEMSTEFSGAYAPEGSPPWLTATFVDGGSPGSVDLTIETTNLTDAEFVFESLFNLDPVLDPTALVFSAPTITGTCSIPAINLGTDTYRADGDGFFDIQIVFDDNPGAACRFGAGDTIEYTITYGGTGTLTPSSFDFLSEKDGGQGEYPTAAHVGGIGPTDVYSGWITTPEPSSLSILVLACLALVRRR